MTNAAAQLQTFEIILGNSAGARSIVRTTAYTVDDAKAFVSAIKPGATCVLRGYTTHQIRQGGKIIGSMQRIA